MHWFRCFVSKSLIFGFLALLAPLAQATVSGDELDELFERLKAAPDVETARQVERSIWMTWMKSGDPEIDSKMSQSMELRSGYDFQTAHETLQQVAQQVPDYPEVWNQLAIVEFYRGNHEQSLEHIARALELEPRHFGAMAGRAVIRLMQGKSALARQNIIEAMKLHPYLPERELFPGL